MFEQIQTMIYSRKTACGEKTLVPLPLSSSTTTEIEYFSRLTSAERHCSRTSRSACRRRCSSCPLFRPALPCGSVRRRSSRTSRATTCLCRQFGRHKMRAIVIYKSADQTPQALSRDHKAADPDESVLIEARGGCVRFGRVDGILAVSCSLGFLLNTKSILLCPRVLILFQQ